MKRKIMNWSKEQNPRLGFLAGVVVRLPSIARFQRNWLSFIMILLTCACERWLDELGVICACDDKTEEKSSTIATRVQPLSLKKRLKKKRKLESKKSFLIKTKPLSTTDLTKTIKVKTSFQLLRNHELRLFRASFFLLAYLKRLDWIFPIIKCPFF